MMTFIYKKETGKSGKDLIKEYEVIEDKQENGNGDKDEGVLAHLKKH